MSVRAVSERPPLLEVLQPGNKTINKVYISKPTIFIIYLWAEVFVWGARC